MRCSQLFDEVQRDVASIRLPSWGRVAPAAGVVPWLLLDPDGVPVEVVREFLTDFVARGNRAASVRSYAYGLLRWWRWLQVVDVRWDQVRPGEVRDYVLWLQQADKPRHQPRTASAATAGTVNPITRKQYLDDAYKPRTTRHGNAVLRAFYEYWMELGLGPVLNPVQLSGTRGRGNAHHNPLEAFRAEGRIRYNPKVAKRRPRTLSDDQWRDVFAALRCHRDRALLALTVSNGARAAEVLAIRGVDVAWGEQLVRVVRKGTRAEQWLPASAETFVWLRLYLATAGELTPDATIWRTVRQRDRGAGPAAQPLNYEALRAVFRRVNAQLGTNWTMHDLRHTAALRMSRDRNLSIRDVQTILGHQHLDTTVSTYLFEEDVEVARRVLQHLAERKHDAAQPTPASRVAVGYDAADLSTLFGRDFQ
jgi:integrase/recombinase XerD